MAVVPLLDRAAIVDELVLQTGGYPEGELDRTIWLESRWDPAAQHPQTKATGLIQFMPNHLRRWGYTPTEVQRMTAEDQAPLIGRYFREANAFGRYQAPGDTYLAIAAPAFLGRADSAIAYPVGSRAWESNPAWRSAGDGPVTVGSIRAVLARVKRRGKPGRILRQEQPYYPVHPRTPAPQAVPWGLLLLAALAWGAIDGATRTRPRR